MNTQAKEWTQQYLRECVADEIALAQLHPAYRRRYVAPSVLSMTADLCQPVRTGRMISPGASRLTFSATTTAAPPRWRRDWEAAGDLHVELGLTISHDQEDGAVSVGGGGGRRRNVTERYEDHPSKTAATWAAIVGAAIQLLEAQNTL